jgi:hypothetical protein
MTKLPSIALERKQRFALRLASVSGMQRPLTLRPALSRRTVNVTVAPRLSRKVTSVPLLLFLTTLGPDRAAVNVLDDMLSKVSVGVGGGLPPGGVFPGGFPGPVDAGFVANMWSEPKAAAVPFRSATIR